MRSEHRRLASLSALALLLLGCDPGEPSPPDTTASSRDTVVAEVTGTPRPGVPWTVIRIIDDPSPNEDPTAGADIDFIALDDASGSTLALGCVTVALTPSPVPFPATDPADNDPASGTLGTVDGDATAGTGYVSLGGATLWCDTGVELDKGDHIVIFEVHTTSGRASAKNDSFSVDLCQTMQGPCLTDPLANDILVTGSADDFVDITIYPDL